MLSVNSVASFALFRAWSCGSFEIATFDSLVVEIVLVMIPVVMSVEKLALASCNGIPEFATEVVPCVAAAATQLASSPGDRMTSIGPGCRGEHEGRARPHHQANRHAGSKR